MAKSRDYLQRQSVIEYLERKLSRNDVRPDAKTELKRLLEWVKRWRPRAKKAAGGL